MNIKALCSCLRRSYKLKVVVFAVSTLFLIWMNYTYRPGTRVHRYHPKQGLTTTAEKPNVPITVIPTAPQRTDGYYTCESTQSRFANFSDYRVGEGRIYADARLVGEIYTDDFCYCRQSVPLYRPPAKLTQTTNPCWWDTRLERTLRCLPYFYIMGFSKSATTDLYDRITNHPLITKTVKEPHWLDYRRYTNKYESLEAYSDMFAKPAKQILSDIEKSNSSSKITGDASPTTAWMFFLWRCFEDNDISQLEPSITNAHVVHALNPEAKLIIAVRNPIDRLYSHYRYATDTFTLPSELYEEPSPEKFHELYSEAVRMYSDCLETASARHCAYNGTLYAQSLSRLQEGMYSVYLRDWLKVFPKEQILLIRFEEYSEAKKKHVLKVWEFLGLEPMSEKKVNQLLKKGVANRSRKHGPMLEETRELLEKFYEPFQNDLEDLIQQGAFTLVE